MFLPWSEMIAVSVNLIFLGLYLTRNKVYLILSYHNADSVPIVPEQGPISLTIFPSQFKFDGKFI